MQEKKLQDLEAELETRTKDVKARLAQLDVQVRELGAEDRLSGTLDLEVSSPRRGPELARWPDLLCPAGGGGPEREATAPRRAEAGRAGERGVSASPPALCHCTSFLPQPLHSPGLSGGIGFQTWLASIPQVASLCGISSATGGRGHEGAGPVSALCQVQPFAECS